MKDRYNRTIDYMRISVTDRCNLRCKYCMPDGIRSVPMEEILTYEEITQIVKATAELGINRIKLTGGEPLVRKHIGDLIKMLYAIPGIQEITLTTNGVLLLDQLDELVDSGVNAINISIDTLNAERYAQITGRDELPKVLAAVKEASGRGLNVKVNTVLLAGTTEEELFQLLLIAKEAPVDVRFIEMMPIGEGKRVQGISGEAWFSSVEERYPSLQEDLQRHGNGPARYYRIPGFVGSIGFISAIHGKFCEQCNRIRLSSTGQLKSCLCYESKGDLRQILRTAEWQESRDAEERLHKELKEVIAEAIYNKPSEHCFEHIGQMTEHQKMAAIGG